MIIYHFRPYDMAHDYSLEVPESPTIPQYFTFQAPPHQEGYYAVMRDGWVLVEGTLPPEPPYNAAQVQQDNKNQASQMLSDTDWTAIPSIADPEQSNPYLANQNEFLIYRSQVRQIAVNPPTAPISDWPEKPDEVWTTV